MKNDVNGISIAVMHNFSIVTTFDIRILPQRHVIFLHCVVLSLQNLVWEDGSWREHAILYAGNPHGTFK